MQFTLTGFTQEREFRVFAFERMGEDRIRTQFTVKADLALSRRYGIRLQELPLMCRGILERPNNGMEKRTFTFSEEEMRVYAQDNKASRDAAANRRKPPRRPPAENAGAAWRVPQP